MPHFDLLGPFSEIERLVKHHEVGAEVSTDDRNRQQNLCIRDAGVAGALKIARQVTGPSARGAGIDILDTEGDRPTVA